MASVMSEFSSSRTGSGSDSSVPPRGRGVLPGQVPPGTMPVRVITSELEMSSPGTFLYFAYGSNLLGQRLLLRNPSAVRKTAARLDDYRLDFNLFSRRWGGCAATIVSHPGRHVWGAVWELDTSNIASLDEQEGVKDNVYEAIQVKVTGLQNETLECRSYQLLNRPSAYDSPEQLPSNKRPSRIYLETILQGAVESKLPEEYVRFLKSFPHNGFAGPVQVSGLNINLTMTE